MAELHIVIVFWAKSRVSRAMPYNGIRVPTMYNCPVSVVSLPSMELRRRQILLRESPTQQCGELGGLQSHKLAIMVCEIPVA